MEPPIKLVDVHRLRIDRIEGHASKTGVSVLTRWQVWPRRPAVKLSRYSRIGKRANENLWIFTGRVGMCR